MISAMEPAPSSEREWNAVVARDQSQNGRFVFAVKTTGVFCLPSCPARRPRRENVEFYPDPERARAAGYRACRRCKPDQLGRPDRLDQVRTILEANTEDRPDLASLARRVGLSPSHLQRTFKARFGVSPRQFALARRSQQLKRVLRESGTVSRAIYQAGYGSSSRVYETSSAMLGMTPGRYARGGAGQRIGYAFGTTRLGPILVAATERGVCAVLIGRDPKALEQELGREFPNAGIVLQDLTTDRILADLVSGVERLIDGGVATPAVPLDVAGTSFQLLVWEALLDIPRGATRSYRDVARAIGRPTATRAVANAIASNRLAVVVPCHRVVRDDGALGGYRWGTKTKDRLLTMEGSRPAT